MSTRDQAVLWLTSRKGAGGGAVAAGGNVLLKTARHKLDGPEHQTADDTTTLDATVDQHGLLPKLSGDAGDSLRGDGTWGPASSVDALDDLSDVVLTAPAENDVLRFVGGAWINDNRVRADVTDGFDTFVWEGDDLVWEWST